MDKYYLDPHFLYLAALFSFLTFVLLLLQRKFFNKESRRYGSLKVAIEDIEKQARTAKEEKANLLLEIENLKSEISKNETRLADVLTKENKALEFEKRRDAAEEQLESITTKKTELETTIEEQTEALYELKSEADLYTRIRDLIDYGHFEEPSYLFDTSERFKIEIKKIRDSQKKLITTGKALDCPIDEISVDGSSKKGTDVISGQSKLLLKAFNIECDLLIEKVSPSNFEKTLDRIQKAAETLEKNSVSLLMGIETEYMELKFEECRLQFQYKLKKAHEMEEQKAIREQMKEEQKAIREYQRALAEAEREEKMYQQMLSKAREELAVASEGEKLALKDKVSILESQLAEALEKEQRAKSLAEQTRKGHVYVISNIGSFGEQVYKIGLTRRLNPEDRVNELGDASVPFKFDIHAIIYSDDSPALEAELHRRFHAFRVNAVNTRKEFFRVSLEQIQSAVSDILGSEHQFQMTALAEEYYESLRLRGESEGAA